jgi:hypothetical protein
MSDLAMDLAYRLLYNSFALLGNYELMVVSVVWEI